MYIYGIFVLMSVFLGTHSGVLDSKSSVKEPCNPNPCKNGAACEKVDHKEFKCLCPNTHAGDLCDTPCNCGNGSTGCYFRGSSKSCRCKPGFAENGDTCEACNCGNGSTGCDFLASSKTCTCNPGFGDKRGICEACNCGNESTGCFFRKSKNCYCNPGFADKGGTCEECELPCENGRCLFVTGEKICTCNSNYFNKRTKTACTRCPCGAESSWCMWDVTKDKVHCSCYGGYAQIGERCEICDRNCGSGQAECIFENSGNKTCRCYYDDYIFVNGTCKSPCDPNPCENGGICRFFYKSWECVCPEKYTGKFCEAVCDLDCGVGECIFEDSGNKTCRCNDDNLIFVNGTCKLCDLDCGVGECIFEDSGNKTCRCYYDDYIFVNGTCKLKEPCNPNPCKNGAACEKAGHKYFECLCPNTHTGDLCDTPCNCGNESTGCYSWFSEITCSCNPGFADKGGTCVECELPCENGRCSFFKEQKICDCNSNYFNNRTKTACTRCPCGADDEPRFDCRWNEKENKIHCVCNGKYAQIGERCEKCDLNCGERQAECVLEDSGNKTCRCYNDDLIFVNGICKYADPCDPNPCENGGICSKFVRGNWTCVCPEKYSGEFCEAAVDPCVSNPCNNGGTCDKIDHKKFKCVCPETSTGKLCETKKSPCDPNPCKNGGACFKDESYKTVFCLCPDNHTGKFCEYEVDPCASNPCQNGGDCTPVDHKEYTCECPETHGGKNCIEEINPCSPNPCKNGGSCFRDRNKNITCSCRSTYTGKFCEYVITTGVTTSGNQTKPTKSPLRVFNFKKFKYENAEYVEGNVEIRSDEKFFKSLQLGKK